MNILVIRFSSLGDLVSLEHTFRAIRNFYPNAHITFLTTGLGKGIYSDSNYFDRYVLKGAFFKTINELKSQEYDLVINLQCNKPSHYFSMLVRKKRVVNKSFSFIQKLFKIKVHSKSPKELLLACTNKKIEVEEYFNVIENSFIHLPVDRSYHLLEKKDSKLIAISIGSSERWPSKQWNINRFTSLVQKLIDNGYHIVLVGSKLEETDSLTLISNINGPVLNYVDKTNLTELKKVLSEVDLYIGNDSGPSHIAAGVSTNTLTIFGSTDIRHCVKFMEYSGIHEYIKPADNIDCHPCYKGHCPTQHECMESITVDTVYNKVEEIFNKEKQ